MAEALAVLGIAANIAQFVGLSMQLASDVKSIYETVSGATKDNEANKKIIEHIHILHQGVIDTLESVQSGSRRIAGQSQHTSKAEQAILDLARQCEPLSNRLLSIFKDLEVPKDAKFRPLAAVVHTFRGAGKKREIQDLIKLILALDAQLKDRISLVLQTNTHSDIMSAIRNLDQRHAQLHANTAKSLEELRQEILQTLSAKIDTITLPTVTLDQLAPKLDAMKKIGKEMEGQQAVLESLMFNAMKEREDIIKNAHRLTMNWIFEEKHTNLLEWLHEGQGIYWIKGKASYDAGSGKSTLMKFIFEHAQTRKALERWAAPYQLVTARYYFWSAGMQMQKSQRGLLQSLLYQVLAASPGYLPHACSSRRLREPWSLQELTQALQQSFRDSSLPAKFCFLIDGLDEYDGDGEDIVKLLHDLSLSSNIKICISSRPWNVFWDAFDASKWKLTMEELTKNDMREYAHSMLNENKSFRRLDDDKRVMIEKQIVEKAQGVWLWVFLVVRDILRDIRDEEDWEQLQARIEQFPAELEAYFADMLGRIDPIYMKQTAEIFLLTVEAVRPLPVFALEYLTQERKDPDYAKNADIKAVKMKDADDAFDLWRKHLNNRCKDLLEVNARENDHSFLRYKVDFLHRTVRDFLREHYQKELEKRAPRFKAMESLCKIMVASIKGLNCIAGFRSQLEHFFGLVDEMMYYCRILQTNDGNIDIGLLEELDRVGRVLSKREGSNHWTNARDPPEPESRYQEWGQCTFLALAVQSRLHTYAKFRLDQDSSLMKSKRARPYLDYSLRPRKITPSDLPYHLSFQDANIDLTTVQLLLSFGANPNETIRVYDGQTVWALFLSTCYSNQQHVGRDVKQTWERIIEELVEAGADFSAKCENPNGITYEKVGETARYKRDVVVQKESRYFTAKEILEAIFSPDVVYRLEAQGRDASRRRKGETKIFWKALGY